MAGTWATDWITGSVVTAAEFRKSLGCVADSTLGVAAASFDFTGLPTTYAHLLIRIMARSDNASTGVNCNVRFNNDSGANYSYQYIAAASSTTVSAAGVVSATSIPVGGFPAASSPASYAGYLDIGLAAYAGTTFYKSGQANSYVANTALNTGQQVGPTGFMWLSTAAINRVTVLPSAGNWAAGSRCSVYVMGS